MCVSHAGRAMQVRGHRLRRAADVIPYTRCHRYNTGWDCRRRTSGSAARRTAESRLFLLGRIRRRTLMRVSWVAPPLLLGGQPEQIARSNVITPQPQCATDEVLRRVQCEFLEMPGLRLTTPQARRLWGLDAASCDALLGALVDANFLFRTRDGAFMRVDHATPLKASLRPRQHVGAA
jgi:hypothetical protein